MKITQVAYAVALYIHEIKIRAKAERIKKLREEATNQNQERDVLFGNAQ